MPAGAAGGCGKAVFGGLLIVIGAAILTGADRQIDAFALDHLPDGITEWLTVT